MTSISTDATSARLKVSSPGDVIAAVSYFLGFHPTDSLVIVGLKGRRKRSFAFAGRCDLAATGDRIGHAAVATYCAETLVSNRLRAALLIGYGPPARVTPAMDFARDALAAHRIEVREALRVTDGRWWSYLCTESECCPPEGSPFDVSTSTVAVRATVAGAVALPDRAAVERTIEPVVGLARVAMEQATDRALSRLELLLDGSVEAGSVAIEEGRRAIFAALRTTRAGKRLTDDDAAWLTVLLLWVRDEAWLAIDEAPGTEHVALWAELVRRASPEMVPAPACLLAYAAWRAGRGALAVCALERATAIDPDHGMAAVMSRLFTMAVSPKDMPPITRALVMRERLILSPILPSFGTRALPSPPSTGR